MPAQHLGFRQAGRTPWTARHRGGLDDAERAAQRGRAGDIGQRQPGAYPRSDPDGCPRLPLPHDIRRRRSPTPPRTVQKDRHHRSTNCATRQGSWLFSTRMYRTRLSLSGSSRRRLARRRAHRHRQSDPSPAAHTIGCFNRAGPPENAAVTGLPNGFRRRTSTPATPARMTTTILSGSSAASNPPGAPRATTRPPTPGRRARSRAGRSPVLPRVRTR